jgi:hypothetical protein
MRQQSSTEDRIEIWLGGFCLLLQSSKRIELGFRGGGCRARCLVDIVNDFKYAKKGSIRVAGRRGRKGASWRSRSGIRASGRATVDINVVDRVARLRD